MARFGRSRKSGKSERKADGQVRQSQLTGAYGAGAMIDLVQHAVLVQGLDSWNYRGDEEAHFIAEPRLKDKLEERYHFDLSDPCYFRLAPAGDDKEPSPALGIRAYEFPAWFVCQGCRRLLGRKELGDAMTSDGRRYHRECDKKVKTVVPVRFVAACTHGHLQDFPWAQLAHYGEGNDICRLPEMFLHEGSYGDFNDIVVECKACDAPRRKLAMARNKLAEFACKGRRPWLPQAHELDPKGCEEKLRLLVRTASNGYFSMPMSALSIEEPEHAIRNAIAGDAVQLRKRLEKKGEAAVRDFLEFEHEDLVTKHGMEACLEGALSVARSQSVIRAPIRVAEYHQLARLAEPEKTGESFDELQNFIARKMKLDKPIPKIRAVTLVHALREVVVQFGFTRLEPVSADVSGEFDELSIGVKRAQLSADETWLPAATLQGEGVFFELDPDALDEWSKRPEVIERARVLDAGWTRWHEERARSGEAKKKPEFLGARFYLLHSLSHLLINSIAMDCGYAASSIKERIYSGPLGDGSQMAGVLLYTGTVGSEGTLGGLVAQGRRLEQHLRRALETGSLCSNDPLCGTHDPEHDPSDRLLHGAACHGCLLIAETSCDRRFNQNLDRALVVPVVGQPDDLAFFKPSDLA